MTQRKGEFFLPALLIQVYRCTRKIHTTQNITPHQYLQYNTLKFTKELVTFHYVIKIGYLLSKSHKSFFITTFSFQFIFILFLSISFYLYYHTIMSQFKVIIFSFILFILYIYILLYLHLTS